MEKFLNAETFVEIFFLAISIFMAIKPREFYINKKKNDGGKKIMYIRITGILLVIMTTIYILN